MGSALYYACGIVKVHCISHWDRVTHICVCKLTIIGSDNGLSPGRCQAIIWINAGILWIGMLGTEFSEILCKFHKFSFKKTHKKTHLKMSPVNGNYFVSASLCYIYVLLYFSIWLFYSCCRQWHRRETIFWRLERTHLQLRVSIV